MLLERARGSDARRGPARGWRCGSRIHGLAHAGPQGRVFVIIQHRAERCGHFARTVCCNVKRYHGHERWPCPSSGGDRRLSILSSVTCALFLGLGCAATFCLCFMRDVMIFGVLWMSDSVSGSGSQTYIVSGKWNLPCGRRAAWAGHAGHCVHCPWRACGQRQRGHCVENHNCP